MFSSSSRKSALRQCLNQLKNEQGAPKEPDVLASTLLQEFLRDRNESTAVTPGDFAKMLRILSRSPKDKDMNEWKSHLRKNGLTEAVSSVKDIARSLAPVDLVSTYMILYRYDFYRHANELEPLLEERLPTMATKEVANILTRIGPGRRRDKFLMELRVNECTRDQLAMISIHTRDERIAQELAGRPLPTSEVNPRIGNKSALRHQLENIMKGKQLTENDFLVLIEAFRKTRDAVTKVEDKTTDPPRIYVKEVAELIRSVRRGTPSGKLGWSTWRRMLLKNGFIEVTNEMIKYKDLLSPRDVSTSYSQLRGLGFSTRSFPLESVLKSRVDQMDNKAIAGVLQASPPEAIRELYLNKLDPDMCSKEMLLQVAKFAQSDRLMKAIRDRGEEVPTLKNLKDTPLSLLLSQEDPGRMGRKDQHERFISAVLQTKRECGLDAITADELLKVLSCLYRGRTTNRDKWKNRLTECGFEEVLELLNPDIMSLRQTAEAYRFLMFLGYNKYADLMQPRILKNLGIMKSEHKALILTVCPPGEFRDAVMGEFGEKEQKVVSTPLLVGVALNTNAASVMALLTTREEFESGGISIQYRLQLLKGPGVAEEHPTLAKKIVTSIKKEDVEQCDKRDLIDLIDYIPKQAYAVIKRRLTEETPKDDRAKHVELGSKTQNWEPFAPTALKDYLKICATWKKHDSKRDPTVLNSLIVKLLAFIRHTWKSQQLNEDKMIDLSKFLPELRRGDLDLTRRNELVKQYVKLYSLMVDQDDPSISKWKHMSHFLTSINLLANLVRRVPGVVEMGSEDLGFLLDHVEKVTKEFAENPEKTKQPSAENENGITSDALFQFLEDNRTLFGHVDPNVGKHFSLIMGNCGFAETLTSEQLWKFWKDDLPLPLTEPSASHVDGDLSLEQKKEHRRTQEEAVLERSAKDLSLVQTYDIIGECKAKDGKKSMEDSPIHRAIHDRLISLINSGEHPQEAFKARLSLASEAYIIERLSSDAQHQYCGSPERLKLLLEALASRGEDHLQQWFAHRGAAVATTTTTTAATATETTSAASSTVLEAQEDPCQSADAASSASSHAVSSTSSSSGCGIMGEDSHMESRSSRSSNSTTELSSCQRSADDVIEILRAAIMMTDVGSSFANEVVTDAMMSLLEVECSQDEAREIVGLLTALPDARDGAPEWSRMVDVNLHLGRPLEGLKKWSPGTWAWWNYLRETSPTCHNVLRRTYPSLAGTMASTNVRNNKQRALPRWLTEFIEHQAGDAMESYNIPLTPIVASMAVESERLCIFVEDSPKTFETLAVDKMLTSMGWKVRRKTEDQWRRDVENSVDILQ